MYKSSALTLFNLNGTETLLASLGTSELTLPFLAEMAAGEKILSDG